LICGFNGDHWRHYTSVKKAPPRTIGREALEEISANQGRSRDTPSPCRDRASKIHAKFFIVRSYVCVNMLLKWSQFWNCATW
jgi:hypothetical protein